MRPHFILFNFLIGLWSLSLYFQSEPFWLDSFTWLKVEIALIIVSTVLLFYSIIGISNFSIKKINIPWPILLILLLAFTIALTFLLGANLIEKKLLSLSYVSVIFLSLLLVYGSLISAIIFSRLIKISSKKYSQILYMFIGYGILAIANMIFYLIFPHTVSYTWIGPAFTVGFLSFFVLGYYLIKRIYEEAEKRFEAEKIAREWKNLALAKDQFLLSLQHHLRTPITPIKYYLERILDGTYGRIDNPVIKEKLIEIKKLADTLYSLMEDLLEIQELKLGKKSLNLENCHIEEIIKRVVEEVKIQAQQKGLYLKTETNIPPGFVIKLDRNKIREAIWNIVDNAIKYTQRGGVTIKSKLSKNKLEVIVEDTGIGMEKEELEHFLQGRLFERGQEAKKLYGPGRGIGLSLAIEFIKAHQGKLWAESSGTGRGTTFHIELPTNLK